MERILLSITSGCISARKGTAIVFTLQAPSFKMIGNLIQDHRRSLPHYEASFIFSAFQVDYLGIKPMFLGDSGEDHFVGRLLWNGKRFGQSAFFLVIYALMISEKLHRTIVAMIGGLRMVLLGVV